MNRSYLVPVFVVVLIDFIGYTMLIPIYPYVSQAYWNSGLGVTLLMASYALMQFIFIPAWGILSDRMGRRPVMVLAIIGSMMSYLIFALSTSYTMLLMSRIVAGIFMANIAVAQSMFADLTTPEKRTKGMALFGVAMGLSFIVGPAIGGMLSKISYATVGYTSAGLCVINLFLCFGWLKETRWLQGAEARYERFLDELTPSALWRFLKQHQIMGLVGLYLLFVFAASFLESTFSLFMKNQHQATSSEVGALLGGLGCVMIFVQGFAMYRVTQWLGDRTVIIVGCAISIVGFLLFASVSAFWTGVVPGLLVLGVGHGMLYTALVAAASRRVPANEQGRALGLNAAVSSLGRAIGPVWAGFGYDQISVVSPFFSSAVVLIGMIVLVGTGIIYVKPRL